MRHRIAFVVFLLAVVLAGMRPSMAADLITARAWFEDKSASLSFEQAKTQEFTPYTGVLSRGIGKGVIWLRLTFDPTIKSTETSLVADRAVLRVRPTYLDSIVLYDPAQDLAQPKKSGDLTPVSQDEFQSLNFNFVLPKGDRARDIYLRVESTSTRMIEAQAFTLAELQREDQGLLIFSGLYLGISAIFFLWAVFTWFATKDRIVFAFIFSQACAVWIGLTMFGYVRLWLSDSWGPAVVNEMLSVSVISAVLAASWFYFRLISEFKPPLAMVWVYRLHIAAVLTAFLLFVSGKPHVALTINWTAAMLFPVINLIAAFLGRGWQETKVRLLPRSILLGYFGVLLLIMLIAGSAGIGFLSQSSAFTVYAPLVNGIVAGALAVAVLQYRVNLSQKYQNQLLTELAVSQKTASQERENREERDRLLAMLGHELKTPLSAMRMMLGSSPPTSDTVERILKAISEMDSVIERSVQSSRVEFDATNLQVTAVDVCKEIAHLIAECREPAAVQSELNPVGRVPTDYEFFRVVVSNLLDNACKYRAAGSTVLVFLEKASRTNASGLQQPGFTLVVENIPGPAGFPDPDKLFTKYYRSPMAHRQSGSGLGSYLIKGLIHKLGGTIEYSPTPEKVRFVLWHPI